MHIQILLNFRKYSALLCYKVLAKLSVEKVAISRQILKTITKVKLRPIKKILISYVSDNLRFVNGKKPTVLIIYIYANYFSMQKMK